MGLELYNIKNPCVVVWDILQMSAGAEFHHSQGERRESGCRHKTSDTSPVIDLEGIEDEFAHIKL